MKAIWKGSISFGLIDIPIELYSAIESHALGFTLLHAKCHTPLKYHRWCSKCDKEVLWDETVKGIKKSNGKYVIFTQEMLHTLRPEKTEMITIVEFVATDQIDILYLNSHYYVAPLKNNVAYSLFVKALENLDKVAIGRFIMRDKEYTCVLQPYSNHLLLTTLHYNYEIRGLNKLLVEKPKRLEPAELKLAEAIITKLSVKKLDMSKFKDTFAQEIKALLHKKTTKVPKNVKKSKTSPRKKPSLTDSLKESLRTIVRPTGGRSTVSRTTAYAKKR